MAENSVFFSNKICQENFSMKWETKPNRQKNVIIFWNICTHNRGNRNKKLSISANVYIGNILSEFYILKLWQIFK
jgi:hypothetical protein